jgi:transposase
LIYDIGLVLLSRKEKEKMVIQLSNEGKTIREIAKIVHMSFKDICKSINKETGEDYSQKEEIEKKKELSPYARAFQMFKDKKPLSDVAIELDTKSHVVLDYYNDYLQLIRMNGLVKIHNELKSDFPLFLHLYNRIKKERLNKQAIADLLQNKNKLMDLNEQVEFYNDHIKGQYMKIQQLVQTINRLQSRIDNYDGINPI